MQVLAVNDHRWYVSYLLLHLHDDPQCYGDLLQYRITDPSDPADEPLQGNRAYLERVNFRWFRQLMLGIEIDAYHPGGNRIAIFPIRAWNDDFQR